MRSRTSLIARWAALLLLFGFCSLAAAQLQLNKDYIRLDPPQPVATQGKIEVIEFFYYGCPICYELEPTLQRWALEAVGELSRLHFPVYDNIHFDGVKLNDEKVMVEWAVRNRIDRQKFLDAYNSDAVKQKVEAARKMLKDYNIHSVPTLIVDGKYVPSARLAGGTKQLPGILNQLVELARKGLSN